MTPVTAPAAVKPSGRWIALGVLSLAQLMVILDSTIVNIALPTAQNDLGFSDDDRQWVVTGYALAFGSLLLLGGRLSDLFGRKRLFLIGVVGFAIASAIGGAAPGFGLLLVARIVQGAFAAMLAPAALSLLSTTFDSDAGERGRAFGIFGAVSGAGGAVGLLLGGILTQSVSWRWCLFINVAIAMVALIGAAGALRPGGRAERMRLDVAGAVTSVLGVVGVVYGLGSAASTGWTDPRTFGSVIVGVVLLVVFVQIERRSDHPLLPLGVILDRDRGAAFLAVGIIGIGSFAVFLFLTYYLEGTLGFTPIQTGTMFLPMVGLLVVGAVLSGAVLMPRFGPRPVVPVGSLLGAAGLALLTGIGPSSGYAAGVLPGLLVLGLGMGLVLGPAQNAATSGVTDRESGVASAMVNTAQQIGGSVGTAVFSALFAAAIAASGGNDGSASQAATIASYHLVFWVAATVFVVSAALAAALFRTGPLATAPEPRLTVHTEGKAS